MSPSRRPIGISLLLATVAGCASAGLPVSYPSRPPSGMTLAQANQDERACVDVASRARVERAWAYVGCMVSKGHTVPLRFHASGVTYLAVTQTRPHEGPAAASELEECRKAGYAAAHGGGSAEAKAERIERAFRACVEPRGYAVQRVPEPRR